MNETRLLQTLSTIMKRAITPTIKSNRSSGRKFGQRGSLFIVRANQENQSSDFAEVEGTTFTATSTGN